MSVAISAGELEQFRELVRRRFGLRFDAGQAGALEDVLRRRVRLSGSGRPSSYLERLALAEPAELERLTADLTIGETYFLRNRDQFRAFGEHVLPERLALRTGRPMSILSAGCASGEEAWSLAIAALERHPALGPGDLTIRAVDLNPASLERARRGRYSRWSLRDTDPAVRDRWFTREGDEWRIDPRLRPFVVFEPANLAEDDPTLWRSGAYDAVFCRNVLMYFEPDVAAAVVARCARALAPGGYLFLGHAETLRGLSTAFHLRHTHATFYYQLGGEAPSPPPPSTAEPWFEVIGRSSARVRELAAVPAPAPAEPIADRLGRAAALADAGRAAEAEAECRALLAIDELEAGAYYLLALCREHAGDPAGAVDHDRTAVYLDAAFAMPRLHLGLLARRRGDRDEARRELRGALALFPGEHAGRVALFGGGFTREALTELCRRELARCEAP